MSYPASIRKRCFNLSPYPSREIRNEQRCHYPDKPTPVLEGCSTPHCWKIADQGIFPYIRKSRTMLQQRRRARWPIRSVSSPWSVSLQHGFELLLSSLRRQYYTTQQLRTKDILLFLDFPCFFVYLQHSPNTGPHFCTTGPGAQLPKSHPQDCSSAERQTALLMYSKQGGIKNRIKRRTLCLTTPKPEDLPINYSSILPPTQESPLDYLLGICWPKSEPDTPRPNQPETPPPVASVNAPQVVSEKDVSDSCLIKLASVKIIWVCLPSKVIPKPRANPSPANYISARQLTRPLHIAPISQARRPLPASLSLKYHLILLSPIHPGTAGVPPVGSPSYSIYGHQINRKTPTDHTVWKNLTSHSFKYLGETMQPMGLNTISNTERIVKLQKTYKITWNHYSKRVVSRNAKLRHCNTVVLPEALYAAETTVIWGMTKIHDIEKQERKILRKIHGAVLRDGTWIRRPTKELYKNTDTITYKFRKIHLQFYGHYAGWTNWMKETQEGLERLKISEEEIKDRKKFRNIIRNKKIEQEPKKEMIGRRWTEERKEKHNELMKRFWEERIKEKGSEAAIGSSHAGNCQDVFPYLHPTPYRDHVTVQAMLATVRPCSLTFTPHPTATTLPSRPCWQLSGRVPLPSPHTLPRPRYRPGHAGNCQAVFPYLHPTPYRDHSADYPPGSGYNPSAVCVSLIQTICLDPASWGWFTWVPPNGRLVQSGGESNSKVIRAVIDSRPGSTILLTKRAANKRDANWPRSLATESVRVLQALLTAFASQGEVVQRGHCDDLLPRSQGVTGLLLSRSKFPVQRKTLNLKVPYYVKENFHSEYQGSLRRLEITVEEEYVNNLRHSCYREKNYKFLPCFFYQLSRPSSKPRSFSRSVSCSHLVVLYLELGDSQVRCRETGGWPGFGGVLTAVACYEGRLGGGGGETMLWKARNFGDRDLFQKAQNIHTPSCDVLNDLQGPWQRLPAQWLLVLPSSLTQVQDWQATCSSRSRTCPVGDWLESCYLLSLVGTHPMSWMNNHDNTHASLLWPGQVLQLHCRPRQGSDGNMLSGSSGISKQHLETPKNSVGGGGLRVGTKSGSQAQSFSVALRAVCEAATHTSSLTGSAEWRVVQQRPTLAVAEMLHTSGEGVANTWVVVRKEKGEEWELLEATRWVQDPLEGAGPLDLDGVIGHWYDCSHLHGLEVTIKIPGPGIMRSRSSWAKSLALRAHLTDSVRLPYLAHLTRNMFLQLQGWLDTTGAGPKLWCLTAAVDCWNAVFCARLTVEELVVAVSSLWGYCWLVVGATGTPGGSREKCLELLVVGSGNLYKEPQHTKILGELLEKITRVFIHTLSFIVCSASPRLGWNELGGRTYPCTWLYGLWCSGLFGKLHWSGDNVCKVVVKQLTILSELQVSLTQHIWLTFYVRRVVEGLGLVGGRLVVGYNRDRGESNPRVRQMEVNSLPGSSTLLTIRVANKQDASCPRGMRW
ncbi:hypothetical protein PR048_029740 [Dryococelus australis]|uniref:DUF1977 domain-containing protein n=1 Tax=Dryococelus australis TaxID=614101 RepID=A0ABQ9GE86_9NEOP|nr:hypothetical protein PR048_029740 [Dryococelus australis]